MPGDTQIVNSQSSAAPSDYVLPASVEFVLKAVNADFDGSAATAFLPAVEIVSDSGHVIAECVDPASSVAAGGFANASFFPGVKHAPAASTPTASGLSWGVVSLDTDAGVLPIGATNYIIPYNLSNGSDTFFMTNDAATFSIEDASNSMVLAQNGFYAMAQWARIREVATTHAGNAALRIDTFSQENVTAASMTSFLGGWHSAMGFAFGGLTFWDPNTLEFVNYRGQNPKFQQQLVNRTGLALQIQRTTFVMVRLGDAKTTGIIP